MEISFELVSIESIIKNLSTQPLLQAPTRTQQFLNIDDITREVETMQQFKLNRDASPVPIHLNPLNQLNSSFILILAVIIIGIIATIYCRCRRSTSPTATSISNVLRVLEL